ncbi:Undecaprenyl phosphate-alpha-4-amino-4-deoxy-L-arabinose arabinosyl transferase [Phycisphaerae bacterium RAS1]|nr:Undecaprenyl phosphate-alpha-4-amino-4-deoxy-L-arabinose arabinosyl transferase [Phycisphaerae bacterium RAS1]
MRNSVDDSTLTVCRTTRFFLLVIAGSLLLRLLVSPWIVLIPEEAYYWMYSKYPALGYLDHPPLVAWCIAAGTMLFGDTEFGVRSCTWLLTAGSTWLCYRVAADWCGRRAGWIAALLFSIAPLLFAAGFLAMPDAPLVFFWLAALLAFTRAIRRDSLGGWLAAGAATGLAFQAKYPATFLAIGALLFLLTDVRGRAMLRRPGPWVGLAVTLIVVTPVLWWNAQHDWASFRFQFMRRAGQHAGFNLPQAVESLGIQFLTLSPLIFALALAALWVGVRRFQRDAIGRWRFAVCFSAPWLAVCVYHGLFSEVHMNWPIPAYLSLLPTAATLLRARVLPLGRKLGSWTAGRVFERYVGGLLAANVGLVLVISGRVPLIPTPSAFVHWDELGRAADVAEEAFHREAGSEPFILAGGRYNLASELGFYMRDPEDDGDWRDVMPVTTVLGGGLNYVNWRDAESFLGRNAILVTTDTKAATMGVLRRAFEVVDGPVPLVDLLRGSRAPLRYYVVRCHRFLRQPQEIRLAALVGSFAGAALPANGPR